MSWVTAAFEAIQRILGWEEPCADPLVACSRILAETLGASTVCVFSRPDPGWSRTLHWCTPADKGASSFWLRVEADPKLALSFADGRARVFEVARDASGLDESGPTMPLKVVALPAHGKAGIATTSSVVAVFAFPVTEDLLDADTPTALGALAGALSAAIGRDGARGWIESLLADTPTGQLEPAAQIDAELESFFRAFSAIFPCRFSSLWLLNSLDRTLELKAFHPGALSDEPITFDSFDAIVLTESNSLAYSAVSQRLPLIISEVSEKPLLANPKFCQKHSLNWFVAFPIIGNNGVIALLKAYPGGSPTPISDRTLAEASAYTRRAASIIRSSLLVFEESLLDSFKEFTDAVLRFDSREGLWDQVAALVQQQIGCAGCAILLVDRQGILRTRGAAGIATQADMRSSLATTEAVVKQVLMSGAPEIAYDEPPSRVSKRSGSNPQSQRASLRSQLLFPILARDGAAVGVIQCLNKEHSPVRRRDRFNVEDIKRLDRVSRLVSILHDKSVLVEERERRIDRNLNSLHHELLAPIDGILGHMEWIEWQLGKSTPDGLNTTLLSKKLDDLKQTAYLVDMLVATMGRDDDKIVVRLKPVSMKEIIQTCIAYLRNEVRRRKIAVDLQWLGVSRVQGDPLQLLRVFYNLLRNSTKYCDFSKAMRSVTFSANETEDSVIVKIADNGVGIVSGEEDIIFEKFRRGTNAERIFPEGTGLGLAYCKRIIERHGGEIRVASLAEPTCFEVKLPKASRNG